MPLRVWGHPSRPGTLWVWHPRHTRRLVGGTLTVIAVVAVLLLAISVYRAHTGGPASAATPQYHSVQAALRASLDRQHLSYQWVACTAMHRRFAGREISRCNVDFGDPHVVPYCAVLVGGALITDRENPALNCGSRVKRDEQGVNTAVAP